ncbi:MAG: hypothetical protein CVV34_07985, partial [Methanomicrobiales archaeon HGW-Methanomicrobiales-5]
MKKKLLPLFILLVVGMLSTACQPIVPATEFVSISDVEPSATPTSRIQKIPLIVFAAGSLIIPFTDIETAFEAKYPGIDLLAEYHGSIQVMRHVTELHEQIDVVATADASLIPMLMYAVKNPVS